tara:strand:+ start:119 stop:319 length:201 start_codon:yes stop_codon:yes gene_type:complete
MTSIVRSSTVAGRSLIETGRPFFSQFSIAIAQWKNLTTTPIIPSQFADLLLEQVVFLNQRQNLLKR